jgi:hypothetical protein
MLLTTVGGIVTVQPGWKWFCACGQSISAEATQCYECRDRPIREARAADANTKAVYRCQWCDCALQTYGYRSVRGNYKDPLDSGRTQRHTFVTAEGTVHACGGCLRERKEDAAALKAADWQSKHVLARGSRRLLKAVAIVLALIIALIIAIAVVQKAVHNGSCQDVGNDVDVSNCAP